MGLALLDKSMRLEVCPYLYRGREQRLGSFDRGLGMMAMLTSKRYKSSDAVLLMSVYELFQLFGSLA
jgi:hypothetical protein